MTNKAEKPRTEKETLEGCFMVMYFVAGGLSLLLLAVGVVVGIWALISQVTSQ